MSTDALLSIVKEQDQDFEWYPTTDAILNVIKANMGTDNDHLSILDCGAGDGRALSHLTKGSKYAIEKSKPLLQSMDSNIFIIGTEFKEQTLIDKKVDIIFSNPPYSEYSEWTTKIITEANCGQIYLVIPERWKDNPKIDHALQSRKAEAKVLGSFDFLDADRAARAKVNIVKINLANKDRYYRNNEPKTDPFDIWFDQEFNLDINNESESKYDWKRKSKQSQDEKIKNALVDGKDFITTLEALYQDELTLLMKNYKAIDTLNPIILKEMDVNIEALKESLKMKVEGLKDRYWQELFNNLNKVTNRLTTSARKRMVDKLTEHTHIDFTKSNAYAILIWIIKNANGYFDSQLIDMVETMTEQACIVSYKSNQRTFKDEEWQYSRKPDDLKQYSLDYRIVLHRVGGLCNSTWEHERKQHNGLDYRAFELLSDIITVANNLGFDSTNCAGIREYYWESNQAVEFEYWDTINQRHDTLMVVRAFKNGNLHIKFNQKFILRLNVEFGRLKGWIKSPKEASDEMDISIVEAEKSFNTNLSLDHTSSPQLLLGKEV